MASDNCTFWNIVSGIIGLFAGAGGTFLAMKFTSKRRDTTNVVQRNINSGGGDVVGGNKTTKK